MRHLPIHPSLVHPRTGAAIRALGFRKDGRAIWPIMGGDGTEDDANDDTQDDESEGDNDGDDTEDSKNPEDDPDSIEYWKKRSRQNEREAKKLRRQLGTKPETKNDKTDDAPDADAIRRQAREEATREVLHSRIEDKIEAKARAFADPEDAVAVLLRQYEHDEFIDDGKVDVDAITEALQELGEKKPHLLAKGKRFKGSADGGTRKDAPARAGSLGEAIHNRLANPTH